MSSDSIFRCYRLDVAGKRFEGKGEGDPLRVTFSVERDLKRFPNKAQISLYNLAKTTIATIMSGDANAVRLEVGYRDEPLTQIFFGELRLATTTKDAAGTYQTTLFAGDGTNALSTSTIARTFPAGTEYFQVLEALVKGLGLGRGNLELAREKLFLRKLTSPLTLDGSIAEEIQEFTRSFGLRWSIQDGAFALEALVSPPPATTGPRFDPAAGLIESPTVDPKTKHVSGKALLNPRLLPGVPFSVASEFVTGDFVATKTHHSGGTHGAEWCVAFEGRPL